MGHGGKGPENILLFKLLKNVFLILLPALILIYPHPLHAGDAEPESKTVEVVGLSAIAGGNTALARDAAIGDALRKAVEQAIGTIVSSETMVENFKVLSDSVYTKTQGYIRDYTVINESETQDLYQVNVRATVAIGSLKDDLYSMGLLHRKAQRPRVLFMIAEKNIGRKYYKFWWWGKSEYKGEAFETSAAETTLKEIFLGKGFSVVDIAGTEDRIEIADPYRIVDLTRDGAVQIGMQLNAEVVVFGHAMAEEGPRTPESAIRLFLADVTAEAVRVDDAAVLASAKGHGTSRNISEYSGSSEAITKASKDLADRLIEQITVGWSGANIVTVRVSGVADYRRLVDFKNLLKGRVRGVEAVYQRSFEGGTAVFELEAKSAVQNIADDISRAGRNLKVVKTTPNTVEVLMEGAE